MSSETDSLRARVLERYVSVYAFCRAHPDLKRATVYLVLSGRYPGDCRAQAAKIQAALAEGTEPPAPDTALENLPRPVSVEREAVVETLQNIRCGHCRRLDRRECAACREQTDREGKELYRRLFTDGDRTE